MVNLLLSRIGRVTRPRLVRVVGAVFLTLAILPLQADAAGDPGRLEIPAAHPPASNKAATGLQRFSENGVEGLYYVPQSYRPDEPLPVLILLHGGGRSPSDWFGSYSRRAEKGHFIIVAPKSPSKTWGARGDYGPDIARINRALAFVSGRYPIARDRVIVGGLSDGASYAVSLGLANGDRVRGVIAYSPGYIVGQLGRGRSSFFVSHGTRDTMLPVAGARSLVAYLRKAGYPVEYREFPGGHEVPGPISDAALAWVEGLFNKGR
jgi:predicted esterase